MAKERVVQYRIEDIQYVKCRMSNGVASIEVEYSRVSYDEQYFVERFLGDGVCEFCGTPLEDGKCVNNDCMKESLYYHENDLADYLNSLPFEYESCVVVINDRKYRFV